MKLISVGDTTYSSDPLKGHHSYPVYWTATGKKYYVWVAGRWYFAVPVPPTGFKITRPIPKNLIGLLSKATGRLSHRVVKANGSY
jgi:hypothetical protein